MDSHGGWIGSATDLVKLLAYLDGNNNKPALISENSSDFEMEMEKSKTKVFPVSKIVKG